MQQHFINDAARIAALKKVRGLVIILLTIVFATMLYFIYNLFFKKYFI